MTLLLLILPVRLLLIDDSKIAPKTAEPKVWPIIRIVLFTPEASPASCCETADKVRLLIWAIIKPMPKPNKIKPGDNDKIVESVVKVARKTTNESALSKTPAWTKRFGLIHFTKKADNGAPI